MASPPPVPPDRGAVGHDEAAGAVAAPQVPQPNPDARTKPRSFAAELPVLILIAFVLAVLLKTFLVQAFYIPSGSMEPTLAVGDRVLVNKVVYDLRDPRRGEIVVFGEEPVAVGQDSDGPVRRMARSLAAGLGLVPPAEKDFIKRVIGLPGDTIEQRGGRIYINGQPLPEATVAEGGYLSARDPQNDFGPMTVPDGEYFVMGDNRPNSADSRFSLGTVPREDVIGRAFVVIWPLDNLAVLNRPGYGGQADGSPLQDGAAAAGAADTPAVASS